MIPKKIHYCWFGQGELPELALKCIDSWKEFLPEYELVLWNEENFDININDFVKEAYESKKYAFVTDYVRLFALYNHGGIYMDTDVEVLKPLDVFLEHSAFTGCENENMCVTGIMGAEKHHPWIEKLLNNYINKNFLMSNGKFNIKPNTQIITEMTINDYSWIPKNEFQILNEDLNIYPFDYFCAKDWRTGEISKTFNTYTIHHFSGSWITEEDKKKSKRKNTVKKIVTKIIGEKRFNKLLEIRNCILNR